MGSFIDDILSIAQRDHIWFEMFVDAVERSARLAHDLDFAINSNKIKEFDAQLFKKMSATTNSRLSDSEIGDVLIEAS